MYCRQARIGPAPASYPVEVGGPLKIWADLVIYGRKYLNTLHSATLNSTKIYIK